MLTTTMSIISSSALSGISQEELREAIPELLHSKRIHLHWVEKSPAANGECSLTAKLEINGNEILLKTRTGDREIIDNWKQDSPSYHTNARLVALERILTDPANEDTLISL